MSVRTSQLKAEAKQKRFDAVVALHSDDKSGDEHRRQAAHAHVMTHHALEMDDPDAHKAAAAAHQKVADMHLEAAEDCDGDEPMSSKGKK